MVNEPSMFQQLYISSIPPVTGTLVKMTKLRLTIILILLNSKTKIFDFS